MEEATWINEHDDVEQFHLFDAETNGEWLAHAAEPIGSSEVADAAAILANTEITGSFPQNLATSHAADESDEDEEIDAVAQSELTSISPSLELVPVDVFSGSFPQNLTASHAANHGDDEDEEMDAVAQSELTSGMQPPPSPETPSVTEHRENDEVTQLGRALAQQLHLHHGCGGACPSASDGSRPTESNLQLDEVITWPCPDTLASSSLGIVEEGSWAEQFPPSQRQKIYCGFGGEANSNNTDGGSSHGEQSAQVPSIVMHSEHVLLDVPVDITFDIDSAGGHATSLAVARQGIHWNPVPAPVVSNLKSSLHLTPLPISYVDREGKTRRRRCPIHKIPHMQFGRLVGFEDVALYVIFPRLYQPQRKTSQLDNAELATWTERVILPALHQCYPASAIQHFPANAKHMQLNATARGIEGKVTERGPRVQLLQYHLAPAPLAQLWDAIRNNIASESIVMFEGIRLFLTVKNLKLRTKADTWQEMRQKFSDCWDAAIDSDFLCDQFVDIGKETCPRWSYPLHRRHDDRKPLTLSWKRCCLEQYSSWIEDVCQSLGPDGAAKACGKRQLRRRNIAPVRGRSTRGSGGRTITVTTTTTTTGGDSDSDGSNEPPTMQGQLLREQAGSPGGGGGSGSTSDSDYSESEVDNDPSSPTHHAHDVSGAKSSCRKEFYPLALLRDSGALTLETKNTSSLRRCGLLYSQFYNSCKEAFAAGNQYPFSNEHLDTLALDPRLVQSWQHVGKAVCHQPKALLRGYLHTKARCHVALQACEQRSFGIREEHRVTKDLFESIDAAMAGQDHPDPGPEGMAYFRHRTATLLGWYRWNLNKFCSGFELVYSLGQPEVVHWEHSRVMMMFLRCLLYIIGGGGRHPSQSNGLWVDRVVRERREGSAHTIEGMGMDVMLQRHGYAWLMDKVDWESMVFRPEHRSTLLFNTPTLQSRYWRNYRELCRLKGDFIFAQDVCGRLQEVPSQGSECQMLLQLLIDLCLQSFRKDVFSYLHQHPGAVRIIPQHKDLALSGRIPLTWPSLQRTLEIPSQGLCIVWGNNMRVRHIEVLFMWLWDWNHHISGDDADNVATLERKHWEHKSYRMLYRQCFSQIQKICSPRQAQTWRETLKGQFIRSHWILPYPSQNTFFSRKDKQLQWWCSANDGLLTFMNPKKRRHPNRDYRVIEPWEIVRLPLHGWERSETPMDLDVNLVSIPQDLKGISAQVSGSSFGGDAEGPSLREPTTPGSLEQYSSGLQHVRHYQLRSYLQRHHDDKNLHQNPHWFLSYLDLLLRDVIQGHERELRTLDPGGRSRPWQGQQGKGIEAHHTVADVTSWQQSGPMTPDSPSVSGLRQQLLARLHVLRTQQQAVQQYGGMYETQRRSMIMVSQAAAQHQTTWTRTQWEECQRRFRRARGRLGQYQNKLVQLSRTINQQVRFQRPSDKERKKTGTTS
jgi:hypothetical protein